MVAVCAQMREAGPKTLLSTATVTVVMLLSTKPAMELSKSPQAPGSAGNVNHRSELPG